MKPAIPLIVAAALASAPPAMAATSATSGPLAVTGNVPTLCSGGLVSGGNTVFALGVLVDTATGLLRTDLGAPAKVLTGAMCNTQSTITISATPLTAQSFAGSPATGFTSSVNYTATAAGWTTTAAATNTGAAANPSATQSRTSAFSGDISVGLSGFTAGGLRLVADPAYSGAITVTLAGVS